MANNGQYVAGSAVLKLNPSLVGFTQKLRDQLKTANVDHKVPLTPNIVGFASKLKTELATVKVEHKVLVTPKLTGFATKLRDELKTVTTSHKVTVDPNIVGFQSKLSALFASKPLKPVKVAVTPSITGFQTKLNALIAAKPLKPIEVKVEPKFNKIKMLVDLDFTQAHTQLTAFRAFVTAHPLTMNVNLDTGAAIAQLQALRALTSSLNANINVNGGNGLGGANRQLNRLTGGPIRRIRMQIEIDRNSVRQAEAQVAQVAQRLSQARQREADAVDRVRLAQERLNDVNSRANSTSSQRLAATQALARAQRELTQRSQDHHRELGRQSDASRNLSNAQNLLTRSFSNFARLALVGVQGLASMVNPATLVKTALIGLAAVTLIPLVGQLAQAAGVLALLPAAAFAGVAAIGTLVIGLSGIKNAFDAVKKSSEDNGKSAAAAQKKIDSAIRGTASAQKGLESAQKSAARTAVDGQRQIASAQKTYNQALKREQDAQKDLSRARKDAAKQLEDLGRQLRGGVLDERDAELAVREAEQRLREIGSDGPVSQIEIERAVLNVDQAKNQLEETRARNRELREESGNAAKAGVEGSELVQDAQERVAEAADNTKDAEQNLARTREDAAQANIDAQDRIVEAQQQVVESQQALNDAISEGDSVAKELEEALSKLAPSARDFVEKMQTLGGAWTDFRKSVQQNLFEGLGDSVVNLADKLLPKLKDGFGGIATEINVHFKKALEGLGSDQSLSMIDRLLKNVEDSIGGVIDGLGFMFQGFLNLAGVGSDFLPGLSGGFADAMKSFQEWTADEGNQQKFKDFIEESLRTFGKIWTVVVEIGKAFGGLFKASDNAGESLVDKILEKLVEFTEWIASPEGQRDMQKFFDEVGKAVESIIDLIDKAIGLFHTLSTFDFDGIFGKGLSLLNGDWGDLGQGAAEQIGGGGMPGVGSVQQWAARKVSGKDIDFGQVWDKISWDDIKSDYAQWGEDMKTKTSEIWSNVSGTVGSWVTSIKDSAFEDFKTGIEDVRSFASEKLTSTGELFGGLKDSISGWLTDIGENVFPSFGTFLESFEGGFSGAIDGIEKVWGRLGEIVQGPIDVVKGILDEFGKLWDKVAGALGLDPWFQIGGPDAVGVTPGSGPKPFNRANGGPIYGAGGPTEDKVPGWLSNGEHVLTAAEVKAAGGHGAVEQLRKKILDRGANPGNYRMGGPIRRFAVGGGVEFGSDADVWMSEVVQQAFADATISSAYRPGHSGFHGKAQAVDIVSPNMQAIADWIYQAYPDSEQLIWGPGPLLYNVGGQSITDQDQLANQVYAGDLGGHFNHIHWANDAPLGASFAGIGTDGQANAKPGQDNSIYGRISRGAGNIASTAKNAVANKAIGLFESGARGLVDKIPSFDNLGEFGKIPKAFGNKMVDSLTAFLRSKAGVGAPNVSVQAGKQNYIIDGGVEQWRPLVRKLFAEKGIDPALEDKYMYQLQRESSGDPNAINLEDSNAKKGTPSKGLAQVIDPTFEAFKDPGYDDIYDPESNLRASLNYLLQDPKFGGRGVDALTGSGYDQGGEAVGKGYMPKKILEPERVLDPQQTSDFNELVRILGLPQFLDSLKLAPLAIQSGAEAKTLEQQYIPQSVITPDAPATDYSAPVGTLDKAITEYDQYKAGGQPGSYGLPGGAGLFGGVMPGINAALPGVKSMLPPEVAGLVPDQIADPTAGMAEGASSTPGSIFNLGKGGQLPWYLTGNPAASLGTQAASLASSQAQGVVGYFQNNWREMLDTALGAAGMGVANSGGGGMTINGNVGYSPKQLTAVYERNQNRQSRANRSNRGR